jgi:hypothetical protein
MRKLAQESGVKFISQRVQLANIQSLTYGDNQAAFDQIILTVGPHLKGLLAPLNYHKKGIKSASPSNMATGKFPLELKAVSNTKSCPFCGRKSTK